MPHRIRADGLNLTMLEEAERLLSLPSLYTSTARMRHKKKQERLNRKRGRGF